MPILDRVPASILNVLLIFLTAFFVATGQVFWKIASQKMGTSGVHGFLNLAHAILSPSFVLGGISYLVGVSFWLMQLSKQPLAKSFASTTGLVYLAVILADIILFSTPLSARTLLGGACVLFGIALTLTQ